MARKILFEGSSEHNHYVVADMVYDGRPARILYAGRGAAQSGLARDDDPELMFHYIQRFYELALSLRPRRVLVIGGGACTLPRAILERLDVEQIDVVELDPLLLDLARRYFGLPDDPRLRLITGDGRQYLEQTSDTYDLIVVDAFASYDIPPTLLDSDAARLYAAHLSPHGAVTVNFISRYHTRRLQVTHQLDAAFRVAFSNVEFYPADPHYDKRAEQNILLVASQRELTLDYLQSSAVELLVSLNDVIE